MILKTLLSLPKITSITHSIEPVWGSDAGRNSNSGKYSGTFIGWFGQIEVNVGKTTQAELTSIRSEIEKSIINITFPDSKTGSTRTADFYGTSIGPELKKNKTTKMYEPFSFTLTAIAKRSDM